MGGREDGSRGDEGQRWFLGLGWVRWVGLGLVGLDGVGLGWMGQVAVGWVGLWYDGLGCGMMVSCCVRLWCWVGLVRGREGDFTGGLWYCRAGVVRGGKRLAVDVRGREVSLGVGWVVALREQDARGGEREHDFWVELDRVGSGWVGLGCMVW